jgi:hypothetical protein
MRHRCYWLHLLRLSSHKLNALAEILTLIRDICGQAPFNVPTVVEVCTSGVVETVFLDKVIGVTFTIEIESSSPSDPMSRETQRETYHLKGISVSVKLW